ncbi:MAG: phosphoribosylglycinamide formyltransferase [Proteobacteria bacterium]|nr:phosphoribosylglycinamide formyltransferase [Pseudomonadota bacterium]
MNTAVFISGNGSNLQAIIDFWLTGESKYELKLVLSNSADAFGLKRAAEVGLKTLVIDHNDFETRLVFDQQIDAEIKKEKIELIALAGFMRLLSPWFVQQWSGRLLNIHPSLLPAFPGLHTHKKALAYGVKYSGCTVFFVDEGIDTGTIIDQAPVKVMDEDTENLLAVRVLKKEHLIFPKALDQVARKEVCLVDGQIKKLKGDKL